MGDAVGPIPGGSRGSVSSTHAQWAALRAGQARVDMSPRGILRFSGPDTWTFLQGQTSNDVLALEDGQGCHLVFANPKGQVLADAYCFRTPTGALLEMERACAELIAGHLAKYLMLADAQVEDLSERWVATSVPADDLPPLHCRALPEGAWLLGAPRLGRVPMALALTEGPAPGGQPIVGGDIYEAVRLEEGVPVHGRDIDLRNLPQDAGLDDALSFSKGCYTGQEPIARLHYRGQPARALRGLVLAEDAGVPIPGASLLANGGEVGRVTSAGRSPGLGRPIALAYIRRKAWKLEEVTLETTGDIAAVRALPLYPAS